MLRARHLHPIASTLVLISLFTMTPTRARAAEPGAPHAQDAQGVITLVLQPGAEGTDASVSSLDPGTNFGTAEWFYGIGLPSYYVGYITFDLSSIPANALVHSAQIGLWGAYQGTGTLTLSPVATPWNEVAVTWANQPAEVTPSMAVTYPISRGTPTGPCYWGCVWPFDVTTIVQAWVDGSVTNRGLKIIGDTPGIGWLMAAGENLSYPHPALTVQYEVVVPTTPTSWGSVRTLYR